MTHQTIEFFFDFNSTYSYLANTKIADIAKDTGAHIIYRPMSVLGVMKIAGNSPTPSCPAKFKYNWADAQRWAALYGVKLVNNTYLKTTDTRPLGRMAIGAKKAGIMDSVRGAFFQGFWETGLDMGDREIIRACLENKGLDADEVLSWADDDTFGDKLKENTQEAAERGAFGAPTFFVGDAMYFGNDRLNFVQQALNIAKSSQRTETRKAGARRV